MKQRVSLKLLVLFGIICTTFIVAESKLHAATVANKSSTFSTQLNNRDDDSGTDSELAEKIRAQRAAIEARENRDAAATQSKVSAKQNNCDNDLRKCISAQCGANYKKCETDSDTTFSDKLTSCRKETTCTAHEFTLFTNEIKEDKKQAIDLAMYNSVIDCGNSYNDCIIQQCGARFNKCLSKSAGDNAITACKQIAQSCTEADSGLVGRVGNVFGIVRQDAEKQIKADETKLQQLRDKMRNSCRTLGAMFDDRTLDCVFNISFYAGDDQKTPKASRKLYAGSLFDCTPDWFGIDVTTFKENAYRATRAQTAASSAMLGSGIGTAVGAITSGAIDRAIETKKAKDALKEECEKAGKKLKDGKCIDKTQADNDTDDDDDDDNEEENEEESLTPEQKCSQSGGTYDNNNCTCPDDKKADGDMCVDMKKKDKCEKAGGKLNVLGQCKCNDETKKYENEQCVDDPDAIAKKTCTDSGGKWKKGKCNCDSKKGLTLEETKCVKTTDATPEPTTSQNDNSDETIATVCKKYLGIPKGDYDCDCSLIPIAKNKEKCEQEVNAIKAKTKQQLNDASVSMKCNSTGGKPNPFTGCVCPGNKIASDGDCNKFKKTKQPETPAPSKEETECVAAGGTYNNEECNCNDEYKKYDKKSAKCIVVNPGKKRHTPCTEADFKSSQHTQNAIEGWYDSNKHCVATKCKPDYELAKNAKNESQGYCKKKTK